MASRGAILAIALIGAGVALVALAGCGIVGGSSASTASPPVATYVGSASCQQCHDRVYNTWQSTLHAKAVRSASTNPQAIQGDWTVPYPDRTLTKDQVAMVQGVQWTQRYVDKDWHIMPAQWGFEAEAWATNGDPTVWQKTNWVMSCAQCHTVGYSTETQKWLELGVGCESCHGPGSRHVSAPSGQKASTIVNPADLPADYAASVCGQCHNRGKSADSKYDYPIGYRVGDILTTANFKVAPKSEAVSWWPDGSVKLYRQQYPEWKTSEHARAGVTCATCHSAHEADTEFATRKPGNELCVSCHSTVSTDPVYGHAPIANAPQHSDCIGCHMAPTGKSGERGDERVHTFRVVRPQITVERGGGSSDNQPNSCNLCHWHAKDKPADLQKALDDGLRGAGRLPTGTR